MKKIALALGAALFVQSQLASAEMLDCAMRDAPFSTKSPYIDILLNDEANAIANEYVGDTTKRFPPNFLRTETPSFAAIINLENLFDMTQGDKSKLPELNAKLAKLSVTDEDRVKRCARYDAEAPELDIVEGKTNILVFDKINGYDHGPSVTAANSAVSALAEQLGWNVVITGNGASFNPETLAQFDLVVWNNNSGDVLTLTQRAAFEDYINNGGGFLGMHGAGGDSMYTWDFYRDKLIGEQFTAHPGGELHFQFADVMVEPAKNKVAAELAPGWNMKDEWYSFSASARTHGVDVVLALDEDTYQPVGYGNRDLSMGDHPIAWSQCIGNGRSFYTAIGHRPEVYYVPQNLIFLKQAMQWAAGQGEQSCAK